MGTSGRARSVLVVVVAALALGLTPGVASGAAKPKGDPITIMTIGEFQVTAAGSSNPEVSAAVRARAKTINKAGGLKDSVGDGAQAERDRVQHRQRPEQGRAVRA